MLAVAVAVTPVAGAAMLTVGALVKYGPAAVKFPRLVNFTPVTTPAVETMATAVAPEPPPPLMVTNGGLAAL